MNYPAQRTAYYITCMTCNGSSRPDAELWKATNFETQSPQISLNRDDILPQTPPRRLMNSYTEQLAHNTSVESENVVDCEPSGSVDITESSSAKRRSLRYTTMSESPTKVRKLFR